MTYHLHTQDLPSVPSIVARHFDSATITHATGLWRGLAEPAAVIELASDNKAAVYALAADLRLTNRQEAVLIEAMPTTVTLNTASTPAALTPVSNATLRHSMPEWLKAVDPVGAYFDREADL